MTTERFTPVARRASVAALLLLATACGLRDGTRLEVRTFPLEHLRRGQVEALIEPYVYTDREGDPGTLSAMDGAVTVRETPDNLERIARVIAEFDVPTPDTQLHFQLIEADGFTENDPRIAAVETELRKLFQFRGYRLAGEAFVTATDGSQIMQGLRTSDGLFEIRGHVFRVAPGVIRLVEISIYGQESGTGLETTVNIQPGQTFVLGSSPKAGSTATLLLTVRAEEAVGPS